MEVIDRISPAQSAQVRSINEVLRDGYRFEFGEAFSRIFTYFADAWALCLAHVVITAVAYVPGSVVASLAMFGLARPDDSGRFQDPMQVVTMMLYVYGLTGLYVLLVVWPMRAGHWVYFNRRFIEGSADFSAFFAVFGRKYLPFVALSFLVMLLTFVWTIVPASLYFETFVYSIDSRSAHLPSAMLQPILLILLGYIPTLFFAVSLSLSFPLLLFHTNSPMEAITASMRLMWRKWFLFFALFLIMYVLAMAGVIAFCIGVLVTNLFLPMATFAIYEQLFVVRTAPEAFS
jgi:hypothetical protein